METVMTDRQVESGHMELTVVVPVYNEMENISPLVSEIRGVLDGKFLYEILYVDDGSSDGTPALLDTLAKEIPCFRFVCHRRNAGQSAAVATGVKNARGEVIATLDGDGQNDPADIPTLVRCLKQARGEDIHGILVVGRRRKRRDPWLKRLSSRIANGVRSRLLKDDTPDTGSGLKVFSRRTFLDFPMFDHMHRFLPALVMRNRGKVLSVEVNHRQRTRGKSKYGLQNRLWVGIVDMIGVMWLQRRPLLPSNEKESKDV
jgi:dolichol-phosphate mannosyltransferase